VANISSAEIARDAASDVQKLLGSSNPYIRKKVRKKGSLFLRLRLVQAALCAIRIIRKVPEIMENFVPRIKSLLTERNHGVLLTGISLMIELCELDPSVVKTFRKVFYPARDTVTHLTPPSSSISWFLAWSVF